jgi:hypothetical protein
MPRGGAASKRGGGEVHASSKEQVEIALMVAADTMFSGAELRRCI